MKPVRYALVFQVTILALIATVIFWGFKNYPVVEWITQTQERLGRLGFWGAMLYPALLALCNLLLLPGGFLAVGAGLFYGLWWGFLLVWLGTIAAAAVAFQISRKLGRLWVKNLVHRHPKWVMLDKMIGQDGWKMVFLSQVHPLFPTSLLNYIYGVTRIRFGPCMLGVALAQAPGLFLYTYLGTLAQRGIHLWQSRTQPLPLEYGLWIGGLAATLLVTTALGKLALRWLKSMEAADE